jgi:hypothetical protein
MTLGCSLHVSHKFSKYLTHKVTSPKKKTKHVVASEKQHIIGVDGMDDVDEYNNYAKMHLFTNFPKKISVVEKNLPKTYCHGNKKVSRGKLLWAS